MLSMAKKKPGTVKTTPSNPRSGSAIQAFIDPEIREAMDSFIESYNEQNEHKATVRSTLEASLKMYLSAKGHWPKGGGKPGS